MLHLRLVGCVLESLFGLGWQLSPFARGHSIKLSVILFDPSKERFPLRQPVGLEKEKTIEWARDMIGAASLAAGSQRNGPIVLMRGR